MAATDPASALIQGYQQAKTLSPSDAQQMAAVTVGGAPASGLSPELESIRNMDFSQLNAKYGSDSANQILNQRSQAYADAQNAQNTPYPVTDRLRDIGISTVQGVANSLGGVGAYINGLISPSLGVESIQGLDALNQKFENAKSYAGSRDTEQAGTEQGVFNQSSDKQYSTERKQDGAFLAGLNKIGRDTVESASQIASHPALQTSGLGQAVGSILPVAPEAAAAETAGNYLFEGFMANRAKNLAAANTLRETGQGLVTPSVIASQEIGGTYQQTVDQVMSQNNPEWNKKSQAEKEQIANATALEAADIQAPSAVLLGKIAERFERHPTGRVTLPEFAQNTLVKEPLEEALQGASSQLATNAALQQNVDPNQSLTEGVGDQIAQGAIYGATAAGVLGSRAGAAALGRSTASAARNTIAAIARNRVGDDVANADPADLPPEENPEAAPVDDVPPTQEIPDVQYTEAQPVQEPEEQEQDSTSFTEDMKLNPEDYADEPQHIKDILDNTRPDKVAGLIRVANAYMNSTDSTQKKELGDYFYNNLDSSEQTMLKHLDYLQGGQMTAGDSRVFSDYMKIMQDLPNNDQLTQLINDRIPTEEQGQTIDQASDNPSQVDPEKAETILNQAKQGTIHLTPEQTTNLKMAHALMGAAKSQDDSSIESGTVLNDGYRSVTTTVRTRSNGFHTSVLEHYQNIRRALASGDIAGAKEAMSHLGGFAQSMQNKIGALNEHFAGGNPRADGVTYQQFQPKGKVFKDSSVNGDSSFVVPTSVKSVTIANRANTDAAFTANVYNRIAKAFPELDAKPIKQVRLNNKLVGNADRVADSFKNPVQEVTQAPVQESPKETEQTTQEPEKTGVEAVYPNVVKNADGVSHLAEAFSYPEEPTSKLAGMSDPLDQLNDALQSIGKLSQFVGQDLRVDADLRDFRAYTKKMGETIGMMKASLQKYIGPKKSILKSYKDGKDIGSFRLTKVLNIAEVSENGKSLNYNKDLLETAVIAGHQLLLQKDQVLSHFDDERLADLLNIPVTDLPSGALAFFQDTASLEDLVSSLGSKITDYWGFRSNPNTVMGYTDGIPQSVGLEMIRAFIKQGRIKQTKWTAPSGVIYTRYSIETPSNEEGLNAMPDLFDKLVSNAEPNYHINEEGELPIAKNVMGGSPVELTSHQKKAAKTAQNQKYQPSIPQMAMYASLGLDRMVDLFGNGHLVESEMNKSDFDSKTGKNISMAGAFNSAMKVATQMISSAKGNGIKIEDSHIRYRFNFSSVARMQMLGPYNPQADKINRDLFLPTWATMDLSNQNSQGFKDYQLALAQMMGIKVHALDFESQVVPTLNKALTNMDDAIKVLQQFHDGIDSENPLTNAPEISEDGYSVIKDMFSKGGIDQTSAAFHAVSDYARYLNTADKSNFRTGVYVEADGVTNGIVNAMQLFVSGNFTQTTLDNSAMGGLFFGMPGMSLNEYRTRKDDTDLYTATSKNFIKRLNQSFQRNGSLQNYKKVQSAMLNLMNMFLDGVDYKKEADLQIKRNVVKNPITIILYGSGDRGIAGNLVDAMMAKVYERMSGALASGDPDHAMAMFSDYPNPQEAYNQFVEAMNTLTKYSVVLKNGEMNGFTHETGAGPAIGDFQNFRLSGDHYKTMQDNIRRLFVEDLRQGVSDTLGHSLLENVGVIQKATQIQSLFAANAFNETVNQMAQDSSEFNKNMLSLNQLKELAKKYMAISPLVQSMGASFFVAGKQAVTPFALNSQGHKVYAAIAHTLSDTKADGLSPRASIYGPAQAGVKGIPMLNIGMGDAQMIIGAYSEPENIDKTLAIFDGIHMAIDNLRKQNAYINKSAHSTWAGNPVRSVLDSYSVFLDNTKEIPAAIREDLGKVFGLGDGAKEEDIRAGMKEVMAQMTSIAKSIDARHKAMDSVASSFDQMAGTASPYQHGTAQIEPENVLQHMQDAYHAAMNPVSEPKSAPLVQTFGRKHSTGVRILSPTAIKQFAKVKEVSGPQKAILDQIMRTGYPNQYKIVQGTPDQIAAYQTEMGLSGNSNSSEGYINFGDKTIYLTNGTTETLVHELIHAATFETLLNHYDSGKTDPVTKEAITRLESLMDSFLGSEDSFIGNADAYDAFLTAKQTINGFDPMTAEGKASAMTEFMAWSLANKSLADTLKGKQAPKIVQIAKDAFNAIKKFIWGRKQIDKPQDDMLSNIRFNTSVVIRSQPSAGDVVSDALLNQSPIIGSNQRLNNISKKLVDMMNGYERSGKNLAQAVKIIREKSSAGQIGANLVADVQLAGFNQSRQEQDTFMLITAALSYSMDLDSAALSRVQSYYAHAMKHITPASFGSDGQAKYDFISGNTGFIPDNYGRSSLLPSFLALAMTSDEFRNILKTIPVIKNQKIFSGDTFDEKLGSVGNSMLDSMTRKVSGEDKLSANSLSSMDQLMDMIANSASNTESYLQQGNNPIGKTIDGLNQYVVAGLNSLSQRGDKLGDSIEQNATTKAGKAAGNIVRLVSKLMTDQGTKQVEEGMSHIINSAHVGPTFRRLVSDVIGRTDSNGSMIDRIKAVRGSIQQSREQFTDHLPGFLSGKFKSELSKDDRSALHTAILKTDLSSLKSTYSNDEIRSILADPKKADSEAQNVYAQLESLDSVNAPKYARKAQQLADYMMTGITGKNLLPNGAAINRLFEEGARNMQVNAKTEDLIEQLTTLMALKHVSQRDRLALNNIMALNKEGFDFSLSYASGMRRGDVSRSEGTNAKYNRRKGYAPQNRQDGARLVVATEEEGNVLLSRGYSPIGAYSRDNKYYFFSPKSGNNDFSQGSIQNIRHTSGGIDSATGYSFGSIIAGRITDKKQARALASNIPTVANHEGQVFVRDANGAVIGVEDMIDPAKAKMIEDQNDFFTQIGKWAGRQFEEGMSEEANHATLNVLADMYNNASAMQKQTDFVDLSQIKDPVVIDALRLWSKTTKKQAKEAFNGKPVMVRKDMIDDLLGYRSATVGDAWTGNSRWSEETQKMIRNMGYAVFGRQAYTTMSQYEKGYQKLITSAKNAIVVKSVVVPMINFAANIKQLIARGVPIADIYKGMPRKLSEIRLYVKGRIRQIEAEAELQAEQNPVKQFRLKSEIKSLEDSYTRLSIWPLLKAGEFSAVTDVGISAEEVNLAEGNLNAYIEQKVDKLPPSVRTAAKYAIISRDTALYQGISKSVQYGDFLSKAILFDHLTKRRNIEESEALAQISDEYINYDRLPGRFRGYLESMGLIWFYSFKMRALKVAMSMMRNNPVQTLLASNVPTPAFLGSIGLPTDDNIVTQLASGRLLHSVGLGQIVRAPLMNPWLNIIK